jgi:hypothetical protein
MNQCSAEVWAMCHSIAKSKEVKEAATKAATQKEARGCSSDGVIALSPTGIQANIKWLGTELLASLQCRAKV